MIRYGLVSNKTLPLLIKIQVPGSASSYSVGAHSTRSYTMGEKVKVPQSTSLYSMSSGSSVASGNLKQFLCKINSNGFT